jgi:hypothetical protein
VGDWSVKGGLENRALRSIRNCRKMDGFGMHKEGAGGDSCKEFEGTNRIE